ncbi:MAG: ArsR family transcriptional regulator [Pirellula sp.]|nr:ArsR family transcriptional regulator [Pirellula sp.]
MAGKPRLDLIDQMFCAFAEPTRLRILHLIKHQETCVNDLVTVLKSTQSHVSRHLLALKSAGLVTCRKNGRWCYYALAKPTHGYHAKLLECLEGSFSRVPEIAADAKHAEKLRRDGGCCPKEC